jgi:metalloendopeptidase OMA1, mitochondrial
MVIATGERENARGRGARGVYRIAGWAVGAPGRVLLLALLVACVTTPITGRRAFNAFSVAEEVPLGTEAFEQMLDGLPRVTSGVQFEMVQRVTERLVAAAAPEDPGYAWETVLIRDDAMVNAFCLPGGKMAVFTGILPVTRDEAGLAVVMGHEIAHALARHGTERVSQQVIIQGGLELASEASGRAAQYAPVAGALVDLAWSLPWGRRQELEADRIGLVLMARAGYDPREAAGFWERMAALGGGGGPSWLSTHPSSQERVRQIEQQLPEVLPVYEAARR